MTWRKVDDYHRVRDDGATICRAIRTVHCDSDEPDRDEDRDVQRWRYRASHANGEWAGPWRVTVREAEGDLER